MKKPRKELQRSGELRRTARMKRGTKRMPRVNVSRQARRRAVYRAFMQSAEWRAIRKAALVRAGRRCEELIRNPIAGEISMMRCTATRRLTVHHKTYARFGGQELPSDLQVLCREHHNALHAHEGWRKIA